MREWRYKKLKKEILEPPICMPWSPAPCGVAGNIFIFILNQEKTFTLQFVGENNKRIHYWLTAEQTGQLGRYTVKLKRADFALIPNFIGLYTCRRSDYYRHLIPKFETRGKMFWCPTFLFFFFFTPSFLEFDILIMWSGVSHI